MQNGYPDESELDDLRKSLGIHPINFLDGARVLSVFFQETGYGTAELDEEKETLKLHTCGWSGCEDLVGASTGTLWWALYWRSTHRGGHYHFARA